MKRLNALKRSRGSIVVFSLMVLSVTLVLTEQLLRSVYVSSSFVKAMVDRERAQVLALSGVTLAIAQLTPDKEKQEEKKPATLIVPLGDKGEKTPRKQEQKYFLRRVFPHLNRWQVFQLNEKTEGIEGEIKICISSEEGKININEVFDFEKQELKKEYEFLKNLEIKGKMAPGEIVNQLVAFFKKRQKKINDISELYAIRDFENIDIFYKPPKPAEKKGEKNASNTDLFLQDIFTIWSPQAEVHPLLFSDSLCAIFGLRRPQADDAHALKDKYKQLAEAYKDEWGKNWDENWKFLEQIYGPKPKIIKNFQGIFSKQFGPKVFSVLSYGKVGSVEQRLLVVIKQMNDEQKSGDLKESASNLKKSREKKEVRKFSNNETKKQKIKKQLKIIALYWL
jgi:hypothetical protein